MSSKHKSQLKKSPASATAVSVEPARGQARSAEPGSQAAAAGTESGKQQRKIPCSKPAQTLAEVIEKLGRHLKPGVYGSSLSSRVFRAASAAYFGSSSSGSSSSSTSSGSSSSSRSSSSSSGSFVFHVDVPPDAALTNSQAYDYTTHVFTWDSSKSLTSITLSNSNWALLDSVNYTLKSLTLKTKPNTADSGIASTSLQFEATATDGDKATDDKSLSIKATRKARMLIWGAGQADSWHGQLNTYLQDEGTTLLNSMGVLSDSQKISAVADLKWQLGDFPLKAQVLTKFGEGVTAMPDPLNISVAWNAEVSANVSYTLVRADPFTWNMGAGFTGMYQEGNRGSLVPSLSTTLEWDISRSFFINAGYEYKNELGLFPIPPSSQIKANNIFKLNFGWRF